MFSNFQSMEIWKRRKLMFDEVFGMAALCAGKFREGVRDTFGASIVADVLDPILKEVDSLRIFNAASSSNRSALIEL
jgi:hypothetical protein